MSTYTPPSAPCSNSMGEAEAINRSSGAKSQLSSSTRLIPSLRPEIGTEGDASIIADQRLFRGAVPDPHGWPNPTRGLQEDGKPSPTALCHLPTRVSITENGTQYQFRSNIAFQGEYANMLTLEATHEPSN